MHCSSLIYIVVHLEELKTPVCEVVVNDEKMRGNYGVILHDIFIYELVFCLFVNKGTFQGNDIDKMMQ